MKFDCELNPNAEVIIYPLTKESLESGTLPDAGHRLQELDIRIHMTETNALTWFFGKRNESSILLVGLGDRTKLHPDTVRQAAGIAGRAVEKELRVTVNVDFSLLEDHAQHEAVWVKAWVEGWILGTYSFDKYKRISAEHSVQSVHLDGIEKDTVATAIRNGQSAAEGTMIARDLGNEPPHVLTPLAFLARVQEQFVNSSVSVQGYVGQELEERGMVGVMAVGRGSQHPSVFLELRYCTDSSKPLIALVGKGITFDTGGISLKRDFNISDMKMDMAGAGAVVGAMDILVKSGIAANVVALIPAAENMPGGNAFLPGEILQYPNGLSVEIGNTDSEGRLVLADALIYAQTIGAERIVDMATLTYSCTGAIGSQYAGIWGDDELVKEIAAAADPVGEKVWQLPLATEYESYLNSHCADICNVSSVGEAGAITAALFLKKFVEDSNVQWAHLDMAGLKDCSSTKGYLVPGATGFGARLLAEWITCR